jgi:IS30 family transposase
MAKNSGKILKKGALSDQEKRSIEQLIKFDSYAAVAQKLNRDAGTIRKFCQRNNLTKDKTSEIKGIEEKKKRSPHFEELANVLTEREMDLAVKIYTDLMRQFGSDILASEEIQVIDFCIISASLNRALAKEKEIQKILDQQLALRDDLEKQKPSIEDDDEKDNWYDKVDQIDLRISTLSDDLKETKKNQLAFFDKKDKANTALGASRKDRAKEIAKSNENWTDFIVYLKTNVGFRTKLGLEIERSRLSINEEFIRLSQLHEYADGIVDHPLYNSEVLELEDIQGNLEKEKEEDGTD